MSNLCNNTEYIIGPEDELTSLKKKLDKWNKTDKLYDILINSGIGTKTQNNQVLNTKGDPYEYYGVINDPFELYKHPKVGQAISFSSLTSYRPMPEMWHDILRKHAPNCHYLYSSAEPGTNLYHSNDTEHKIFQDEYIIDHFFYKEEDVPEKVRELFKDIDSPYDHTKKEAMEIIQSLLEKPNNNITEIELEFGNKNYIFITPYEFERDENQL